MSNITYAQVVKKILRRGFTLKRQAKGSHEIWTNGISRVIIPNHRGNIPTGTLSKILKGAGYKNISEFISE